MQIQNHRTHLISERVAWNPKWRERKWGKEKKSSLKPNRYSVIIIFLIIFIFVKISNCPSFKLMITKKIRMKK
jgi:hypothetical protein